MAKRINLRKPGYKARQRQVQTYGTQTPLSSTAVERGSTRWLDGSTVFIEGLLDVTGTTTISGALNVSGNTTLSGATTIAGPTGITGALTIAGQLDVTGPTTLAGTLDITGDTSLTGDMDVLGGGKINIGTNMTLEPNTDGGAIAFQDGAKVSSVGGTISMSGAGGVSSIVAGLTSAGLSSGSARYLAFNDGSWDLGGPTSGLSSSASGGLLATSTTDASINAPTVNIGSGTHKVGIESNRAWIGTPTRQFDARNANGLRLVGLLSTAAAPNLYADPNGWLYRTTWTP